MPSSPDRTERLAAQLRENLKRRKAQARSRRAGEADGRAGLGATELQQEPRNRGEPDTTAAILPESGNDGEPA
jgi:hypothetical protein